MFHKLLVNIDDEAEPLVMLEKAARLAQAEGQLELFSCVSLPLSLPGTGAGTEAEKRARHAYMTQSEGRLDHLAERIRLDSSRIGTDVCWGRDRVEALQKKCERFMPDLLLYPVATESGLLRRLLASDEWKVLRRIEVPLLLTRERPWGQHPRIAVALDPFHPRSEPAALDAKLFAMAHALATQLDAELHVLHTYEPLPQSAIFDEHRVTDFTGLQEDVMQQHRQQLEALLAPWQEEAGAAELHLLEGELHQQVAPFCEEYAIDLLLIGNVPRGTLDRLLLGSSAERVLNRIHCDLLVIRPDP